MNNSIINLRNINIILIILIIISMFIENREKFSIITYNNSNIVPTNTIDFSKSLLSYIQNKDVLLSSKEIIRTSVSKQNPSVWVYYNPSIPNKYYLDNGDQESFTIGSTPEETAQNAVDKASTLLDWDGFYIDYGGKLIRRVIIGATHFPPVPNRGYKVLKFWYRLF